ncbi:Uncharacterised protein [Grimontia hollisae]|nr:Uncharacterised protein [Grimontia hollisae]
MVKLYRKKIEKIKTNYFPIQENIIQPIEFIYLYGSIMK